MFFFTSSSSSFSPASFVVVRLPRVSVLANESPSGGKKKSAGRRRWLISPAAKQKKEGPRQKSRSSR